MMTSTALATDIDAFISMAETGNPFDLCAIGDGQQSHPSETRARFNGVDLMLGHWIDREPVAIFRLRRHPDGPWHGKLESTDHPFMLTEERQSWAWHDLKTAFARHPPSETCSFIMSLFYLRMPR